MTVESGSRVRNLVPVMLLLILAAVVLWKAALLKGIPYTGDITGSDLMSLNLPRRVMLGESLHAGRIPLWLDGIHNGFPHLAEGQTGIFYPPNLILYALLPPIAAFNYGLILNFFLAGLFTYLLCRALGPGRAGSLLAAISFMFCGFFVARIKHVNMINVAAWLPLLLYFAERFNQKRQLRFALYAGLTLGVMILAGHPHITYYSALAMGAWLLWGVWRAVREEGSGSAPAQPHPEVANAKQRRIRHESSHSEQPKQGMAFREEGFPKQRGGWNWRRALPFIPALLLIGVVGAGIAAVQLLPSMELTRISTRSAGMPLEEVLKFPFRPEDLANFAAPYRLGNPAEGDLRTSDIAVDGIFWENCAYIGLVALAMALLALVVCRRKPALKWLAGLTLVALWLALGKYGGLFLVAWKLLPGLKYFRFPARFLLIAQLSLAVMAAFGLEWVLDRLRGSAKGAKAATAVGTLVLLLAAADLLLFANRYIGMIDAAKWMAPPPSVKLIRKSPEPARVYTVYSIDKLGAFWQIANNKAKGWKGDMSPYLDERNLLSADNNLFWGVPHFADRAVVEGGLGISDRTKVEAWLVESIHPTPQGWQVAPNMMKLLGMYNVRWLLSGIPILSKEVALKEVSSWKSFETEEVRPATFLYENLAALPRAYVVPRFEVAGAGEFMNRVNSGALEPSKLVLTEKALPEATGSCAGSSARVLGGSNGELEIEARMTGDGYLVVTDNHYPGWRATLDGAPVEVVRGNLISRALFVPKGNHRVVFRYEPGSYRIGLFISLLTLLGVSAGLSYLHFAEKRNHAARPAVNEEEMAGVCK